MKSGDRIGISFSRFPEEIRYFTVEEFRYCLGIFRSINHREAGAFTPLCHLYVKGPDSENGCVSNFGEYKTNLVPGWFVVPEHLKAIQQTGK